MSEFLFLFRGGSRPDSPEQAQQITQKWISWIQELGANGHIKNRGQALEGGGKVVANKQKTITDGPYAETKDIVYGYTLIQARDLDHAAELTQGCPIFETGGLVEVRPVVQMNM